MKWQCGKFQLEMGAKTYVMGIVNVTPDSFSGDGKLGNEAIERALQQVEDGADILDIGGESTRPGAAKVSFAEELRRVLPVIEALSSRAKIPLSIDTTKSEVAKRAVEAGASLVNDVSGATFDDSMLETVAQTEAGLILMHLRGTPQSMNWSQNFGEKGDVIAEILDFWQNRLDAARLAGISDARLAFDAGFGFGKSVEENLEIVRSGRKLSNFGFPTLSATSRKSTIGRVLGVPVEERVFGSAALAALAIANGADLIRVHDVKAMAQVAKMADSVCRRIS